MKITNEDYEFLIDEIHNFAVHASYYMLETYVDCNDEEDLKEVYEKYVRAIKLINKLCDKESNNGIKEDLSGY